MLAGRTDPISGPSHKATWVATKAVAIRNSSALSQTQTLRGGYAEGVSKALGFSPLDGKARSTCVHSMGGAAGALYGCISNAPTSHIVPPWFLWSAVGGEALSLASNDSR
jgi:hypothetical protein